MRRWVLGISGVVAVVAIIGVGLNWRSGEPSEDSEVASRPTQALSKKWAGVHAAPTPPPSGSLRIRGTVRDEHGPVAGAHVSATRPMPGETLSELPCPSRSEGSGSSGSRAEKLPDCMDVADDLILELVGAREGEAPQYAETVTAADGSFVLEGLPEGDFSLWALGPQGAQLRPGVKAGAQDVELVLEEGVTLEGTIVDESDQPLAGAQLTILRERHTRFFDTRSGPDGRFRVGPLPKGAYGIVAASEGLLPEFEDHDTLELLEWKVMLARPKQLVGRVLRDGAPVPAAEVTVKSWDCQGFPEWKLKTDAKGRFTLDELRPCTYHFAAERDGQYAVGRYVLSRYDRSLEVVLELGSAFHVEGTVWDEARHPVEGAEVKVSPEDDLLLSWKSVTDARGHYRIGPLKAGSYGFEVSSAGYMDSMVQHEVTRASGPVDLTLKRAFLLAGRVVDDEGQPVPAILLSVGRGDAEGEEAGFYQDTHATSDAEGRFTLDAPRAGTWELSAEGGDHIQERMSVQAPDGDVRFVLHRGATVTGTVSDSRDIPQERLFVTLWKAVSPGEDSEAIGYSLTDAQGRFTFRGVKAGSFVVEVTQLRDGIERAAAKPLELQGSEQVDVVLRFEEGRTLSGVVEDGRGQPVAGASVEVSLPSEAIPRWRRNVGRCGVGDDDGVLTGPDGRFTLRHLVADRYELSARKQGYTFAPAKAVGAEPAGDDLLRVSPGTSEVRLVLERKGRITGRVLGPAGTPLEYFSVNGRSYKEPEGTFEMPFDKSGVEHLEFSALDLAPELRSVEVSDQADVNLGDVRLGPGRRVTGRVVDAETGAPIAGAEVGVTSLPQGEGEPSVELDSRARTQADGTFELPHVQERPLMLTVAHEDYREGRAPLGASSEPVTLRLEAGARIEVTVRNRTAKPVHGQVALSSEDGQRSKSIGVKEGTGTGTGVEPGLYVARVVLDDRRSQALFLPQQVRIPESGRVVLNFQERMEGVTLALRAGRADEEIGALLLVGRGPLPVSRAGLDLWMAAGLFGEMKKGVMTFEHLPPGHATVLLMASGSPSRFQLEELELPAEGVVERVVSPRWQPFPEK